MSFLQLVFFFCVLLISPLAYLLIGRSLIKLCLKLSFLKVATIDSSFLNLVALVLGLLFYLNGVFLLAELVMPFSLASALMFLPAFFSLKDIPTIRKAIKLPLSFNFCLWFPVIVVLGVSLFSPLNGISTVWVNNYGDLTWHLGMISSFVFGNNFPVENHLLAGEALAYPLLINIWTASLWQICPSYSTLAIIFAYQWVFIWLSVFFFLNALSFPLLPWALLLGGGAYEIVWRYFGMDSHLVSAGPYAHSLISKNYPWTPFLTTLWVTQRSVLLGVLSLTAAMRLIHFGFLPESKTKSLNLFLAGCIFALSVLAHTHFMLVGVIYVSVLIVGDIFKRIKSVNIRSLLPEFCFYLGFLPAVVFLPWLLSKASIFRIVFGWMPWNEGAALIQSMPFWEQIFRSARMWLDNAGVYLALVIVLPVIGVRLLSVAALVLIFIAANFFQFAVWDWDQIKIFVAIYVASLCLWAGLENRLAARMQLYLLLLVIPTLFELLITAQKSSTSVIYSEAEIAKADAVRMNTEKDAIILAAPDHNSPITLSGRRLFAGYEGTLFSHGLNYQDRNAVMNDIESAVRCGSSAILSLESKRNCPKYLFWTERESRRWKRPSPEGLAEVSPGPLPFLYKIN